MDNVAHLAHAGRRSWLQRAAGLAGALALRPVLGAGRSGYAGPNVIIVRFGGGVRRRETIEPGTSHAPYLLNGLAPRGVLFRNMVLDDAPHVVTSHGQGTLYLLTGRYDPLVDQSKQVLGERFEPPAPTLFEYFRKAFDVPPHQGLIVNGEDREAEEFYTFSNHHQYGIDFRSEVLSMFRFKTFVLRRRLAEGQFPGAAERARAARDLARRLAVDPRRSEHDGQSAELERFWSGWADDFGRGGLINARGDRLITQLARRAMRVLEPRLMMLNYQDPDYVHWGYASHYTRAISVIDAALSQLVDTATALPFYRDNTVFVVVPDCGRDDNPFTRLAYQHHFNSRPARQIWALVTGPGIQGGRVVTREVSQVSVATTVAAMMGFSASESRAPVLRECFG